MNTQAGDTQSTENGSDRSRTKWEIKHGWVGLGKYRVFHVLKGRGETGTDLGLGSRRIVILYRLAVGLRGRWVVILDMLRAAVQVIGLKQNTRASHRWGRETNSGHGLGRIIGTEVKHQAIHLKCQTHM
jgi:hypothetical protein